MSRISFALILASAVACADGSGPTTAGQMNFQVATEAGSANQAGNAYRAGSAYRSGSANQAAPDTISLSGDVLVMSRVELVLREVEFERIDDDACDSTSTSDDSCEEVERGPFLLDLPLGAGAQTTFTVAMDTGTYGELEFELHKPEDDGDAADLAFLTAHPDLKDVSVRVSGTFNGADFVFTSDVNAEQELDLQPPLAVGLNGTADVTLFVDVRGWFVQVGGTGLIEPALAMKGQAFEAVVKNNIETSFEVFEDGDHDGAGDT